MILQGRGGAGAPRRTQVLPVARKEGQEEERRQEGGRRGIGRL